MSSTLSGGTAASEWHVGTTLDHGSVTNLSLITNATTTLDVDVSTYDSLTVTAELTGAASGDLTVTVLPFRPDGVTLVPNSPVPTQYASGPTFAGSVVDFTGTYDVGGYTRVRITVQNKNAATQTLNFLLWRLSQLT